LDSEVSSRTINDSAILKKLTGMEDIFVEGKYEKGFHVRLFAKPWFSCNLVPNIINATNADYRRHFIIEFPNTSEGPNEDKDLTKKLTTDEELAGIFNVLMKVLRRVNKNGGIWLNEKTIEQRRGKYEIILDPIGAFVNAACAEESSLSDFITKDDFYKAFELFCQENRIAVMSRETFNKYLSLRLSWGEERVQVRKHWPRCWIGHKLTLDYHFKIGGSAQVVLDGTGNRPE